MSGDSGDDELHGGAGGDTFIFREGSGHDDIEDFNRAEGDKIRLHGIDGVSEFKKLRIEEKTVDSRKAAKVSSLSEDLDALTWSIDVFGTGSEAPDLVESDFIFA